MQNTIHIMSIIRFLPLCGGRPMVISPSVREFVRASVTNRFWTVTFWSFKTGFAYLACR